MNRTQIYVYQKMDLIAKPQAELIKSTFPPFLLGLVQMETSVELKIL